MEFVTKLFEVSRDGSKYVLTDIIKGLLCLEKMESIFVRKKSCP